MKMTPLALANARKAKRDFETDRLRETARELNQNNGRAPISIRKINHLRNLVASDGYFESVKAVRMKRTAGSFSEQRKWILWQLGMMRKSDDGLVASRPYEAYLIPIIIRRIESLLSKKDPIDVPHSTRMAMKWLAKLKVISSWPKALSWPSATH